MENDIRLLIQGYEAFHKEYFCEKNATFRDLVKYGQDPKIMIIACSDSRVDPAIILNSEPGELFIIRNVANLVPPYDTTAGYHGTSAALEFGICTLGIRQVIVFGHSQCGGITALVNKMQTPNPPKTFLHTWIKIGKKAYEKTLKKYSNSCSESFIEECSRNSLIQSLHNLKTFPWIAERLGNKSLFLHAWYFDLKTGTIFDYQETTSCFKELTSTG